MNTMLPSAASASRERRIRTLRLLLDEHRAIRTGNELRVTGCECGAKVPPAVHFGEAWHRGHVALVLADA